MRADRLFSIRECPKLAHCSGEDSNPEVSSRWDLTREWRPSEIAQSQALIPTQLVAGRITIVEFQIQQSQAKDCQAKAYDDIDRGTRRVPINAFGIGSDYR